MKQILVIDDDEKIRGIFKRFLSGHGYAVVCAEDGREGLRLLEANAPDLVITDIMMPYTDGLEVVLSMREKHPDTPVIAISGGMTSVPMDFLPMVKKFGACKVLYKPVVLADLLASVEDVLGE
jgi:two-component system, chemotaxis family, chemotaxis protein CheY